MLDMPLVRAPECVGNVRGVPKTRMLTYAVATGERLRLLGEREPGSDDEALRIGHDGRLEVAEAYR